MILDGREIETAWWGPGPEAAPTLVLLHEGLGCVALWRDVPAALAAATGCGVFAYSRFGYGRSAPVAVPRPLDYMHVEAREVLPRVLDAAAIERCVLVGHSDGGSIAAIHGGSCDDDRVRGLALIAAHFFVEPIGVASIAEAREAYQTGDLRPRLARYHDDVDGAFWGWNRAWLDPDFPRAFDLSAELARIRTPTLLIQGEDDPYGTTAQFDMARRRVTAPLETLLIPDARHAPHLEAPTPSLDAIAAFARRMLREGASAL
ncbi:MAG TPA: alpha/beta hydrolase [Acetobacteraceae bacterium]|nr:alpha/beta hydrolase [Acetobacteraceae bacterium]